MTVPTTTNKTNHVGTGSQTVFPYNYLLLEESHMFVLINDVQQLSGYTIDGVGNPNGGNVTLATAPDDGVIVTLLRLVPETQEIDYQPYDPFPAPTHERGLDKLTMMVQQLQEQNDRTLIYPPSSDGSTSTLFPSYEPGNVLGWDKDSQVLRNFVPCECPQPEQVLRKTIGGRINENGTINKMVGDQEFTVTHSATGFYTINFAIEITQSYVVVPQIAITDASWRYIITATSETSTGFTVAIRDPDDGSAADRDWSFLLEYTGDSVKTITVPNGNFETGDLSEWNIDLGAPLVDTQSFVGTPPQEGSYLLCSSELDATARIKSANQIDLVASGVPLNAITSGTLRLTLSWYQARAAEGNDPGRVGYRIFDVNQVQIGGTVWSTSIDVPAWTQRSLSNQILPVNTRFMQLWVESSSNIGGAASAYFDNIQLFYTI